jgi:flagellar biosynthesis protein FlhF
VQITGIIPKSRPATYQSPSSAKESFQKESRIAREIDASYEKAPAREPLDFAGEKEKLLALAGASKDNNTLKEVLAEVKTIKEKLESQSMATSRGANGAGEEHPTINRIDDVLILNDFSSSYRKGLLERVRKEFSLDALDNYDAVQDKVLEWIGEGIKIYEAEKFKVRPRIMVLVGPTGVGKTTTVAKLAVNFGINFGITEKGRHKRRIVLVTIDSYRIKAKEQLEAYCEIMGFPCFSAGDYDELKKIIAINSEKTDLILIDTIGKSPRDMARLGEMKMLLDACGSLAEVHLAMAATTKTSDIEEILKTFEPFNYKSVIITKMDETMRIGNIIGALSEKAKPVSYITNGQEVHADIRKASVVQFLINLEGFKVNRVKLEEKFPDRGDELMR